MSTTPWTGTDGDGGAHDHEPLPDHEPTPAHSPLPDQEPLPDDELAPPHPDERLAPHPGPGAALDDTLLLLPPRREERFLPPPRPEDRITPAPLAADRPPYLPAPPPDPAPTHHIRPPYLPDDLPPSPPRPEDRLGCLVSTPDLRRLDLQAALTAAGVAPVTGDSAAVHRIAHLDEGTVTAVISWIAAAAQGSAWPRTGTL